MASAFFFDRRSPSSSSSDASGRPERRSPRTCAIRRAPGRRRDAGGLLGRELALARCSGSTARAGARRGRRLSPGLRPWSGRRPPITGDGSSCAHAHAPNARRVGQPARQAGGAHGGLDRRDVVGDPVPGHASRPRGRGRGRRPRVAVAGLADAARVEQRRGRRRARAPCRRPAVTSADPVGRRPRRRPGRGCGRAGPCVVSSTARFARATSRVRDVLAQRVARDCRGRG